MARAGDGEYSMSLSEDASTLGDSLDLTEDGDSMDTGVTGEYGDSMDISRRSITSMISNATSNSRSMSNKTLEIRGKGGKQIQVSYPPNVITSKC